MLQLLYYRGRWRSASLVKNCRAPAYTRLNRPKLSIDLPRIYSLGLQRIPVPVFHAAHDGNYL
jgi:hypothetical protein